MRKPVYVFSGFLDAGKTTAIKESLLDPNFNDGETTLIIAFEQGDVEYDDDFLYDSNSVIDSNDCPIFSEKAFDLSLLLSP